MKGGPGEAEQGMISLKNLHHHTPFTSSFSSSFLSSFLSPPQYNENKSHLSSHSGPRVSPNDIQSQLVNILRLDEGKDEEKNYDSGKEDIGLPVPPMHACPSIGQLPSPPNTPRTHIHTSTTRPLSHPHPKSHHPTTYYRQPYQTISSSSSITIPAVDIAIATTVDNDKNKEDEQVRIGMATLAEKPNLTIHNIFVNAEQYKEACERGEELLRTGSTWSSVIQKSLAFAFSPIVPPCQTPQVLVTPQNGNGICPCQKQNQNQKL